MKEPLPQDPAAWAARIRALKNADPFQAFSVVMASDAVIPVTRPENIDINPRGTCADVKACGKLTHTLALEWVADVEIGGEVDPPSRPPKYAAKLRALPDGPLVITMDNGQQFPLAGPYQLLVAPDGQSVAVCKRHGGLVILDTSEISELEPGS